MNPGDLDTYRNAELALLDNLSESYFKNACAGDMDSADLLIEISERRAKLLGLNAPTRAKVEVINYDTEELLQQYETLSRGIDSKDKDILG